MRYLFGSVDYASKQSLADLQQHIGIEAFLADEYYVHNTGFSLPDHLMDAHPFKDWRRCRRRVERHKKVNGFPDDAYPQFAGISDSFSDAKFYNTRRLCDELGLKLYAHSSLFGEAGDVLPAFGTEDVDGDILDDSNIMYGIPVCPNNNTLTDWTADGLAHVAASYPIDGFDFDHAHYPSVAAVETLFLCGCSSCRQEAARTGLHYESMAAAARELKDKLAAIDTKSCNTHLADADTLLDFFELLAGKPIRSWFQFRTTSTMNYMRKMATAIRAASTADIQINCQLAPPSISFYCGQDISELTSIMDVVTPGWGHWVGWEHSLALSIANVSSMLLRGNNGLDEAKVVRHIARISGFTAARVPESVLQFENRTGYCRGEVVRNQYEYALSRAAEGGTIVPPLSIEVPEEEEYAEYARMLERSGRSFVYGSGIQTKEDAARVGL